MLVDGGFPNGYSRPVRSLPPLHLIWGSADRTFPLPIGRELERATQQLGGPVSLDVPYISTQARLINSGQFMKAINMDILDIKRIAMLRGDPTLTCH
ncbi:hypothetical protein J2768_003271 [Agrobacterium tumefaciens]|uniref:hypothetical protein n=1 Tax=Agrobacterium tumefaciens TaxID=358 RepID=UPI001F334609|nr:hypothetical protein [Agrobacterium tumefaciens]MBP2540834.1 hypothetical protein [Agrobacterium tumefaciens]